MLSRLVLILTVAACGSCMEMRETVERMVMVRTTGSDLQPAATGYIYKKKNDGHESVIEMGESEIMEQLSKLYDQPKPFAAPIPVTKGRVQLKEDDESNAESKSQERIIPVKEKQEDHIDGIADDDYKKIFDEYTAHYDDNTGYDDYLRKIGLFDDEYKEDAKRNHDGYKGFKKNDHFGNGKGGDYHNEKYESYAYKKEHDRSKDHKNYEHDNKDADEHKTKAGHDKEGNAYGFHKVFDREGHRVYDNDGNKVFAGHKYQGADSSEHINARREGDNSRDSGHESNYVRSRHHNEGSGEKHGAPHFSEERDASDEKHGEYTAESRPAAAGQSYGFEIKH